MLKQILFAASLALVASPAVADPDKNESGKRYEDKRDRDRYEDDNPYYGSSARYDRNDRYRDRRDDRYRDRRVSRAIPAGHLPPPGSCRVWFYDRPAGHQPTPTNCRTARYDAERFGGRVIRGDRRY